MFSKGVVRLFFILMAFVPVVSAQVQTGMPAMGTFDTNGPDVINLGNLNVLLNIPVVNKPGRGIPLTYSLAYNSSIWYPVISGSSTTWQPVTSNGTYWGWQGLSPAGQSGVFYNMVLGQGTCYANNAVTTYQSWSYSGVEYIDPFGGIHRFSATPEWFQSPGGNCPPNGPEPTSPITVTANDGSGYQATISANQGSLSVVLKNSKGTTINAPDFANAQSLQGTLSQEDSNGNEITVSNGQYKDTTGTVGISITGSAPNNTVLQYSIPGETTPASYTVSYKAYAVATNFGCSTVADYGPISNSLVDKVTLPDGSFYEFNYEATAGKSGDITGRLASVTLPTGGTISYSYFGGTNSINCTDGSAPGMSRVTTDGTRTYERAGISGNADAFTTLFQSESGNQTLYHFSMNSLNGNFEATHAQVYQGTTTNGTLLEEVLTCYNGASGSCDGQAITATVTEADVTSSYNGGSQLLTKNTYDSAGVVLTYQSQYNGTTLQENTKNTYNITGSLYELLSSSTTDGSGNAVASTTYGYDETSLTGTSGLPQHVSVSGTRGNQTSTHVSTGSSTLTTTTAYYDTGMPVSTTAPGGFTTGYGYDSTQTFTTSTNLPTPSSGVALSTSATYDATSGMPLSATGMNSGQTFTFTAYDSLLHPTHLTTPESGETSSTYTQNQISVTTEMSSSQSSDQETFLDSYGRVRRVAIASSSGWYLTDSCYTPTGLLQYQSTAYVSPTNNTSSYNCSASTGKQFTYDALGRKTAVSQADGSSVSFQYNGRATKMTTSNGVSRITQYDLLGRISAVCEISGNASMPGSGSPTNCGTDVAGTGFLTNYAYSLSNHTVTVSQGQQQRIFQTDAAGRTLMTNEPESGVANFSYAYNAIGLAVTRTRPAANVPGTTALTTTVTQYDSIGRPVAITYNDGKTPTKNFAYDTAGNGGSLPNQGSSKGQLTIISTGSSSTITGRSYKYDNMGRVTETVECMPAYCGSLPDVYRWYGYDLASDMTTEEYATQGGGGSPATLTYSYNTAGQLTYVRGGQGSGNNGTTPYSTDPATMTPFGPKLTEAGNGLFTVYGYDLVGHINYGYVCAGSTQASCTNGTQIYAFVDTVLGKQVTHSGDSLLGQQRDYTYDEFGRLAAVSTTPNSGPAVNMNFIYDRWGNRTQQQVTAGSGPQPQLSFNTAKNQISGYTYDAVGNVYYDGSNYYTYDAENNLIAVNNGTTAAYQYDALNERVAAQWNGNTQDYGIDLYGRRSTTWTNSATTISSVQYYAGKKRIAYWSNIDSNIHFEHQDWLGTERVRTTANTTVEGTFATLPYGDGMTATGNDYNLSHFAQTDEDIGSGSNLDHAAFREFGATAGRWMSPDPYSGSYQLRNPQSLNRYAYALNSPLSFADPSGLAITCTDTITTTETYENVYNSDGDFWEVVEVEDQTDTQTCTDTGSPNSPTSTTSSTPSPTPQAPNNAENPPPCQAKILNATNNQFGTNYIDANVNSTFNYSTGAGPGQGTLNLNITASTAGVTPGYYPIHWYSYIIGYGPTLHVVSGPGGNGGLDSQQTLQFGPNQGTFHIDSGYPRNPFGAIFHGILNMTKLGGYPKC